MSVHDGTHQGRMPPIQASEPYPADKARGAEIILRKPWQRVVFFGGLVGLLVLGLILQFAA